MCVCVGGGGGGGRGSGGGERLINPLNAAAAQQKGRHRKRSFSHWLAKSAQVAEVGLDLVDATVSHSGDIMHIRLRVCSLPPMTVVSCRLNRSFCRTARSMSGI